MRKLRSFTKPGTSLLLPAGDDMRREVSSSASRPSEERGMEGEAIDDPIEDAELVIDSNGHVNGTTSKQIDGDSDAQPTEEDDKGKEDIMEVEEALTSETLEELVDIMEIEIDDQETGGGEGGREAEKMLQDDSEVSVKVSSKPEPAASASEAAAAQSGTSRRRRHSLALENIDFPIISIDKQLSDDEVIDLMSLLHVCCALKTQTQMYLLEEEAASILSLIACTCPPFSPAGVRFIEVTLCVLLACPFLIRCRVYSRITTVYTVLSSVYIHCSISAWKLVKVQ